MQGTQVFFRKKPVETGGLAKKIPAERGSGALFRRGIRAYARFFSFASRQASRNAARSASTTVAPTGVLHR